MAELVFFALSLFFALVASSPWLPDITIYIPSTTPYHVSGPINPAYPGFAFEQASFYNYSFDAAGNPNTFSSNLIFSVLNRTGGTPILRVGGTSGDFGHYNASQPYPVNRPATQGGPAFTPPYLSVGPSYFKAFENFPGCEYVFMVPLEHRDLNNTLEWARRGLQVIGDRLQAVEIGNEPNLYDWFNVSSYVDEYVLFEKALAARFPAKLSEKPIFQALDTASGGAASLPVSSAIRAGINATGAISQVAYHLYQASDAPNSGLPWLQTHIANHTAITQAMSVFEPDIQYLARHSPGVSFILSEVGNSLGSQDLTQRNVLATALWNVDYQLHGMAIGVSRVNNQQILLPGFQMWEPVASDFGPPLVRANFYSQPLVAEFIGSTGNSRVAELGVDDTSGLRSAYVAFEDDEPARIALVNLELWTPSNGTRPNTTFTLANLPKAATQVRVHTLTAPEGAYANQTLTWKGLQWTYESEGREVQVGELSRVVEVRDRMVRVGVEATSAVVVELETCFLPEGCS